MLALLLCFYFDLLTLSSDQAVRQHPAPQTVKASACFPPCAEYSRAQREQTVEKQIYPKASYCKTRKMTIQIALLVFAFVCAVSASPVPVDNAELEGLGDWKPLVEAITHMKAGLVSFREWNPEEAFEEWNPEMEMSKDWKHVIMVSQEWQPKIEDLKPEIDVLKEWIPLMDTMKPLVKAFEEWNPKIEDLKPLFEVFKEWNPEVEDVEALIEAFKEWNPEVDGMKPLTDALKELNTDTEVLKPLKPLIEALEEWNPDTKDLKPLTPLIEALKEWNPGTEELKTMLEAFKKWKSELKFPDVDMMNE